MLTLVAMFSGNAKERKRQRALCVAEGVDNADITKAGKVIAAFGTDFKAIVKEHSRLNVAYTAANQELGVDNRGSHGNHKKAGGDDRREFLGMTKKQQQAEIAKAQARVNWMIKNSK